MTKKVRPTNIDDLKKFLDEQPEKARILRQDAKDALDDEELRRSASVIARNAEIRAKRNIKE